MDEVITLLAPAVYLDHGKFVYLTVQIFLTLSSLPLPPDVLDEGVGHAVPGGGPAGGRPQHGVRAQVRGRVDHGHRGAVARYVVT